jgi:ribosome-associated translation inhibitor RaiA
LRSGGKEIDEALRSWIYERSGRQLGKFAPQIERVMVRFGDVNGPRGGVDTCCLIQVTVSALPAVVVEECRATPREAFDLAVARAERAVRRHLQKHGFSSKASKRHTENGKANKDAAREAMPDMSAPDPALSIAFGEPNGSLIGKRVGHAQQNLLDAQTRPEKEHRDRPVDTSMPGVAADDRKAGYGHTAARNTKLNTSGMTHMLEDSQTARPSRKSTRAGTNRIKPDNPLTRRTKSKVHSPRERAARRNTGT